MDTSHDEAAALGSLQSATAKVKIFRTLYDYHLAAGDCVDSAAGSISKATQHCCGI